jgi:hypothetical protein
MEHQNRRKKLSLTNNMITTTLPNIMFDPRKGLPGFDLIAMAYDSLVIENNIVDKFIEKAYFIVLFARVICKGLSTKYSS